MCNCVRKCVGFYGFPQLVVILPVKRFADDSRAKGSIPSHIKALARDSTTSYSSIHNLAVHPISRSFLAGCLQIENCFGVPLRAKLSTPPARARRLAAS